MTPIRLKAMFNTNTRVTTSLGQMMSKGVQQRIGNYYDYIAQSGVLRFTEFEERRHAAAIEQKIRSRR